MQRLEKLKEKRNLLVQALIEIEKDKRDNSEQDQTDVRTQYQIEKQKLTKEFAEKEKLLKDEVNVRIEDQDKSLLKDQEVEVIEVEEQDVEKAFDEYAKNVASKALEANKDKELDERQKLDHIVTNRINKAIEVEKPDLIGRATQTFKENINKDFQEACKAINQKAKQDIKKAIEDSKSAIINVHKEREEKLAKSYAIKDDSVREEKQEQIKRGAKENIGDTAEKER